MSSCKIRALEGDELQRSFSMMEEAFGESLVCVGIYESSLFCYDFEKQAKAERVSLLCGTAHPNGILAFSRLKMFEYPLIKSNRLHKDVILPQYQEWPFLNLRLHFLSLSRN